MRFRNLYPGICTVLCLLSVSYVVFSTSGSGWAFNIDRTVFGALFCAFLLGLVGALCYCWGVRYGFLEFGSKDNSKPLPAYMATSMDMLLFCALGGLVALVFQAPQGQLLAPIQAFVLGATWPSVVNRVISGNQQQPPVNPINPTVVQTPAGAATTTATSAQPPATAPSAVPPGHVEQIPSPASPDA